MATNILAAIDLADLDISLKVLSTSVSQAKIDDARLTVLSVVPDFVGGLDYRYAIRGERGGSTDYDVKEIVEEALQRLNEVVSENTPEGMEVETIVRHGVVYDNILQVAEQIGADQIVIGAQTPQIAEYLLGSNAAMVVRHAHCSVNVVRP